MNASQQKGRDKPRLYLLVVVIVLLLAAALRIIAIRDAPPGPRFDETFDALMARRILNGERPLYFPENFGEEALNQYFQAVALTVFGWSDLALRFPSFVFGMIEVATVYALGRWAWNRRAGLLAAALCAASFWAVFFSRLGMRLMPLTAFVSLGVLMLFKMQSVKGKRWPWGTAAGVLFGLSVHIYTAARALPLLLIGAVVYLALFNRSELRRQAVGWMLVLVIAALIAAPLAYYLVTQPQAEARLGQVSGPLDALRQGDVMPLVNYALAAFGMFGIRGGDEWLYNLPGRPILDPLTALVFLFGIIVAVRRHRSSSRGWCASRTAFVLIWLVAGLAPILLSWPPASSSHAILAQPAVYLLAGLGLDATLSFIVAALAARGGRKSSLPVVSAFVIITLNVALTVRDYFGVWNTSDPIRWEHQATVTAMGRYTDARPELRDVAFMGNAVDYHNPWMKMGNSLTSRRTDARWFNPARALVWDPSRPMTYFIPFRDPNPVTFNQIVSDAFYASARQTLEEKLPDGRPVFTAYALADASTLHAQAMTTRTRPYSFDGWLALIGYEARPAQARPGDAIRVLTYWRVERMARGDASALVMFVHLLGTDGKLVAQEDRLDVAVETLHVGDEFLQTHRVMLPGDAHPGTYRIAIGLYSPVTNARVLVAGNDQVEFSLVVR
jgi:4-amino-4-deoxy-L-arabinose transferase-like glycosyltransferase